MGLRDSEKLSIIIVYEVETPVEADGNPKVNEYGAYGISMAALNFHSHTRQENTKYGEVEVSDYGYEILVYYANGLSASYYLPNSGKFYEVHGDYPESVGAEIPKLVFKEDVTGKSEDVAKSLKQKGYDAYENGPVIVGVPDVGMRLETWELDEYGLLWINHCSLKIF